MSWIPFTADHVKARLSKDEYDSYTLTGGQLTSDGTDIVAAIISQVTAMVRGKVASCRDNLSKLGPAGTIPSECLFSAATIARDALVGALPLTEGATDVRKEELRHPHVFPTGQWQSPRHPGRWPVAQPLRCQPPTAFHRHRQAHLRVSRAHLSLRGQGSLSGADGNPAHR